MTFKKFLEPCLKFYKLDPSNCFSSPGLSLKMTRIKLKQISEIYMYLFIEKGLRGRISYICKRYSEANNEFVKNHDPGKPTKHISYLDENNLCG